MGARRAWPRVERVVADGASWDGAGWRFENGRVVESPSGSPGVRQPVERLTTSLNPRVLVTKRFEGYGNNLSWRQIGDMFAGAPMEAQTRAVRAHPLGAVRDDGEGTCWQHCWCCRRSGARPRNMLTQTCEAAPIAGILAGRRRSRPAFELPGAPPQVGVFATALILAPLALAAAVSVRT